MYDEPLAFASLASFGAYRFIADVRFFDAFAYSIGPSSLAGSRLDAGR